MISLLSLLSKYPSLFLWPPQPCDPVKCDHDISDTLVGVCVCVSAPMQFFHVYLCLDIGNSKISNFLLDREKQMCVTSLGELPSQPSWWGALFYFAKALQRVQGPRVGLPK